jgi:hypothetical protein
MGDSIGRIDISLQIAQYRYHLRITQNIPAISLLNEWYEAIEHSRVNQCKSNGHVVCTAYEWSVPIPLKTSYDKLVL